LREDGFISLKPDNLSPQTGRPEKQWHIESGARCILFVPGVANLCEDPSRCGRGHAAK
jgi:hypothetical protein